MQPTIVIENLSKQYRLGTIGTGTISNDLKRWWYKTRGKEDPYLKIGESNDRNTKGESEYVWALRDINLQVMPGEILGIIGKNGAGKSTLLKILSKVTGPTTGSISFNGRIGSLLEVGTGFHPELTGRENIFLNGAILGMTKNEIRNKLDEIIDFSGCERYIDTPVKRYSSGMTVRLGFAVAAHLEPEILVVDEVLAVGDAEFQKKAIGKMQDVSKNDGRTVLFVSHNMAAVKTICERCTILKNGTTDFNGSVTEAINKYLNFSASTDLPPSISGATINENIEGLIASPQLIKIESIILSDKNGTQTSQYISTDEVHINFKFQVLNPVFNFRIMVEIKNSAHETLLACQSIDSNNTQQSLTPGKYSSKLVFPANLFASNTYMLKIHFLEKKIEHQIINSLLKFNVRFENPNVLYAPLDNAYFRPQYKWSLESN